MARETKRMALYEAIRKGQSKRAGARRTVGVRSTRPAASPWSGRRKGREAPSSVDAPGSCEPVTRRQEGFLSRRIEFSLSYLTVGVILLAFMVVVAGAVRVGQMNYDRPMPFLGSERIEKPVENDELDIGKLFTELGGQKAEETDVDDHEDVPVAKGGGTEIERVEVPRTVEPARTETTQVKPEGDNVIVIQAYNKRRDLVPVQEYFEDNGVETEILERRNYYFLVTTAKYHGFGGGADGALAMKKIKEVGARYKAPSGYERFRPNLFQDAYGEKIR